MPFRCIAAALLSALVATGCGDSSTSGGEDAAGDTQTTVAADTTAPKDNGLVMAGLACCAGSACDPGEYCLNGACHAFPASGACYAASDCETGQECVGGASCPCEEASCETAIGACEWPAGCCNDDSGCGAGEVCALGVCHADPGPGACWSAKQCNPGQLCDDVKGCPCGIDGCTEHAGFCAQPGACCISDKECGANGRCVGGGCVARPDVGRCFEDGDCPGGEVCAGAAECACGGTDCAVPTSSGTCKVAADACCVSNADCGAGSICVDGEGCVPLPAGEACYLDEHCGVGRVCDGANTCPCGVDCDQGWVAGACRTVATPCQSDGGCGPGMRCVVPDTAWCPIENAPTNGVCVQAVDAECWSTDDCAGVQRCSSERVCTSPLGCSEPNVPGRCEVPVGEGDCCNSHRECEIGYECRNSNTTTTCPPQPTAVCLPAPKLGETCWNYLDCPPANVCNEAFVCACGAMCHRSRNGYCSPAATQYCNSNSDCGDSFVCARDYECIANPCFVNNDCAQGGVCKPKNDVDCWNSSVCGDGNYCKGLRICPANTTCTEPDKSGVCAPLGGPGECCSSYYGCDDGLRCISAIGRSGCSLDASSVCVPYTQFNISCFADEDCAENRTCEGAKVCICNQPNCDGPPVAGNCVFKQ